MTQQSTKSWLCRLGKHHYVRTHAAVEDGPSVFYLECKRCGKFHDLPWTTIGSLS